MKTKLHLGILMAALLLAGCNTSRVESVNKDGTTFKASNSRVGWKSRGVDISYDRDTNGVVKARARMDQSGSDAEMARSIAEGVATGLKPTP